MRWPISLIAGALICGLWAPAHGEQIKYYVWTDDQGVTHAEDRPPKDRDYETRVIEVDTSGSSSPPAFSRGISGGGNTERRSSSSSGRSDDGPSRDDLETTIADEEQQRLDSNTGVTQSGRNAAQGGSTATSGSAAPGAGAAAGGPTAGGAALAPPSAIFGP